MPKTKIDYDVVVGGASISGLLTARELAKNGNSVLIVEEHKQVCIPEHCDGLVSKKALKDLSISPDDEFIQTKINDVKLHSPSENELYVNSENLQMIVLNRSKFEIDRNLEQMREMENNLIIMVGLSKSSPLGVDTESDLKKISKELKNSK